jgi:hypothetical protein
MATVKSEPASKAKKTKFRPPVRKRWKPLAAVGAKTSNKGDSKESLYVEENLICHL